MGFTLTGGLPRALPPALLAKLAEPGRLGGRATAQEAQR